MISSHIQKLSQYNDLRDVAEGLMVLIAEERGLRVGEVMGGFGLKERSERVDGEGEGEKVGG